MIVQWFSTNQNQYQHYFSSRITCYWGYDIDAVIMHSIKFLIPTSIQHLSMQPTEFIIHGPGGCQNLCLECNTLNLIRFQTLNFLVLLYSSSTTIYQFSLSFVFMSSSYFITCNYFLFLTQPPIPSPMNANSLLFITSATACSLPYVSISSVPIIHAK